MKYSVCLAVLVACTSGLTHAATSFPNVLNEGVHTQTFSATQTLFSEDITFTLAQDSIVTGSFSAASGNVTLTSLSMLNSDIVTSDAALGSNGGIFGASAAATDSNNYQFAGKSFDLGLLAGQNWSMGSGTYTFNFVGFKNSQASNIQISLNVAPVPEPSTWAMLALGLVGVAGLSASKRKRELMN